MTVEERRHVCRTNKVLTCTFRMSLVVHGVGRIQLDYESAAL